jgi:hypothetical protein
MANAAESMKCTLSRSFEKIPSNSERNIESRDSPSVKEQSDKPLPVRDFSMNRPD